MRAGNLHSFPISCLPVCAWPVVMMVTTGFTARELHQCVLQLHDKWLVVELCAMPYSQGTLSIFQLATLSLSVAH